MCVAALTVSAMVPPVDPIELVVAAATVCHLLIQLPAGFDKFTVDSAKSASVFPVRADIG